MAEEGDLIYAKLLTEAPCVWLASGELWLGPHIVGADKKQLDGGAETASIKVGPGNLALFALPHPWFVWRLLQTGTLPRQGTLAHGAPSSLISYYLDVRHHQKRRHWVR